MSRAPARKRKSAALASSGPGSGDHPGLGEGCAEARDASAFASGAEGEPSLGGAAKARARRRTIRVRLTVEDAIQATAPDAAIEKLLLRLDATMEAPGWDRRVLSGPVGRIVAELCDELGVEPDLSGFTDTELGIREVLADPAVPAPRRATIGDVDPVDGTVRRIPRRLATGYVKAGDWEFPPDGGPPVYRGRYADELPATESSLPEAQDGD